MALQALKEKMKTIQCEIDNLNTQLVTQTEKHKLEQQQRNEMEAQVSSLKRQIVLVNTDLTQRQRRLDDAKARLESLSRRAHDSEKERNILENKQLEDDSFLSNLEETFKEAKKASADAEHLYEESKRKHLLINSETKKIEQRSKLLSEKNRDTKLELEKLTLSLKQLETVEIEANEREEDYIVKQQKINQLLQDAENRADSAERALANAQRESAKLQDQLNEENSKYKLIKAQMDELFGEQRAP